MQRKKLIIHIHIHDRELMCTKETPHTLRYTRALTTADQRRTVLILPSASTCSVRPGHRRLKNQRDSPILRSSQFHYYTTTTTITTITTFDALATTAVADSAVPTIPT